MAGLPVLAVNFVMNVVAALFIICGIVLILVILIQKGRGGGLGGVLSGGAAGGILGSKTGDFLTWVTIGLVGFFLLLAVVMAKFYRPGIGGYGSDTAPVEQTQPAPPEQPVPPEQPAPDGAGQPAGGEVNVPGGQ